MRGLTVQRAVWKVPGDQRGACPFHAQPGPSHSPAHLTGGPRRLLHSLAYALPFACRVLSHPRRSLWDRPLWGSSEVVHASLSSARKRGEPDRVGLFRAAGMALDLESGDPEPPLPPSDDERVVSLIGFPFPQF